MQRIVIHSSRTRVILLLVVSVCFVAGGVLLLAAGGPAPVAWMSIIFFGGCAVVIGLQVFDTRPRIVIDDRGIVDRTLKVGLIEWPDIRSAFLAHIQGNPFLCLDLVDPAKYVERLSPMMRHMVALNRKLGFTDLSLNLTATRVEPERLEELIQKELAVRGVAGRATLTSDT